MNCRGVGLQHFRAEAVDRFVGAKRARRLAGILESLHGPQMLASVAAESRAS